MKLTRRHTLGATAGLLGTSLLPRLAGAQTWPTRPITVAMAAPAGGATDLGTRAFVDPMRDLLGARSIAFQDMSGAGGVQALDYVRRQPTDGHFWLGSNDVIEAYPSLGRIDFDWRAFDFWMSGGTSCAIVVPANSPYETFDDWVNAVMERPGEISVASTPSGSLWSNAAVYLQKQLGLDFRLANYAGGGPTVRAVLAGETDCASVGVTPTVNFVEAGELRLLTAWTPEAWEVAGTTVPSILETVDDPILRRTLPWTNIHGIALAKGVDEAILEKIDTAFNEAMASPAMDGVYRQNAFFPFRAPRQTANDLMGERTALQAYIIEVILGTAVKTRDELDIPKLEDL
jgi:tripartite-type tricarboxylate transporter receptor subunit TctC